MMERYRQVIFFGQFESISFDALRTIDEVIRDDLGLVKTTAAPDIRYTADAANYSTGASIQRPLLLSENEKYVLQLGSKCIVWRQLDAEDDYEDFINKSMTIAKVLKEKFEISYNRFACTGSFIRIDREKMETIYREVFNVKETNANVLVPKNTNEWNFTISEKKQVGNLDSEINRIRRVICGERIIGSDGTDAGGAVIEHECNTVIHKDNKLSLKQFDYFMQEARNLRELILGAIK